MKKLSKNEVGLGAVETLLIILIVVILGAVGYYVWKSRNNENVSTSNTTTSNTSTTIPSTNKQKSKLSDDWFSYKSSTITYNGSPAALYYTVKLPNGMTFISNPDGPSIYSKTYVSASSAEKATVEQSSVSSSSPEGVFLITSVNDSLHVSPTGNEQASLTAYDGAIIKKYASDHSYQYILTKGDHALTITYTFTGNGDVSTIEEMVKTLVLY